MLIVDDVVDLLVEFSRSCYGCYFVEVVAAVKADLL